MCREAGWTGLNPQSFEHKAAIVSCDGFLSCPCEEAVGLHEENQGYAVRKAWIPVLALAHTGHRTSDNTHFPRMSQ